MYVHSSSSWGMHNLRGSEAVRQRGSTASQRAIRVRHVKTREAPTKTQIMTRSQSVSITAFPMQLFIVLFAVPNFGFEKSCPLIYKRQVSNAE